MNPAIDLLCSIGNDWLSIRPDQPGATVDQAQGWLDSGTSFGLILLPFVAYAVLQYAKINQARIRNVVTCLMLTCFWQLSCAQLETVEKIGGARQGSDPGCDTPGCVPVKTVRAPKGTPPPTPQGLPVPVFSLQEGTVAFGTKIQLSVSTLPTGAVIEYSYDGGKIWIPGDQAAVLGTGPILARTRINDLTSNPAQAAFTPYHQRMLVIGNSIMNHAPLPAKGWFNNNGMAASAPEKDFVHLLTAHLAKQYPQVAVRIASGGNFEREFGQSTYSLDEFNEPLQQFKPDLIIVRIGENVEEGDVLSPRNFEAQFRLLLQRLATYSGQPARIICTTSVWKRPQTDIIIRRVAAERGLSLVDLSGMVNQEQYFAFGQYADAGVAAHPNDTGMKRIAELIQAKLP